MATEPAREKGEIMRMRSRLPRVMARLVLFALLLGLIAVPARSGSARQVGPRLLARLSGSVVTRYYMARPDEAPPQLRARLQGAGRLADLAGRGGPVAGPPAGDRFNDDIYGFPQNEEAVSVCRKQNSYVLGGTNDYRGLLDLEGNLTGWHFSDNSGGAVANEGLLPPIVMSGLEERPSGGDPVTGCVVEEGGPNFYMASLNYDPFDPFGQTNGIGVYKTDLLTLQTCPTGDESCWPDRRPAAEADLDHFLDKPWMDAGDTGDGTHVWVTYTDFTLDASEIGFSSASIYAVRCLPDVSDCTSPILISGDDVDVQFSDVTIGTDERTYFSWVEIEGELEGTAQTFVIKTRVAETDCDDSTCIGPEQIVTEADNAIPFGGALQGNDFRVATYPKIAMKKVDGDPRIFVAWEACTHRLSFTDPPEALCEKPKIKLRYSDDDGATWSSSKTISKGGVNYFVTIASDRSSPEFVVAWFTNRFDGDYLNAQDIEMVTMDAESVTVLKRQHVTSDEQMPNEPEADPLLGGTFIGDYIEVAADNENAWLHYNMNIRDVQILFEGKDIPQQDNFLSKVAT
jgi:hypothetical protein